MITKSSIEHKETFDDLLLMKRNRSQLLQDLPVTEKRILLSGISTAFLEGGSGLPIILLHGPGENSFWWMRIITNLVRTNKIIIPDLPGHAASKVIDNSLEPDQILAWLSELINHTCVEPPVLVGHVLGGAIAARYAIVDDKKLSKLVLVDTLGLAKFRPSFNFAFGLIRFIFQPSESHYLRFLPHCMYDMKNVEEQMGDKWDPFIAYNLECANDPDHKNAAQIIMKKMGLPRIPPKDLAAISTQTALIWGRHDRANKLDIAQTASKEYCWPLYIIEDTRDDPKLERPEKFVEILRDILTESK